MRNPGGYAVLTGPVDQRVEFDGFRCEQVSAGAQEIDTFTCFHCGRVIHVKPKMDAADLGGLCKLCMKLICPACLGNGCSPLEKKLEQMEARGRALRSYGL